MLITRNDRKVSQSRPSQTAQAVCLIRGDLEALAEVDAVKFVIAMTAYLGVCYTYRWLRAFLVGD